MTAFIESGHARNLANLKQLIITCTSFGSAYAPSKSTLTLTALNAHHVSSMNQLDNVLAKKTDYSDAVNARVQAFADLRKKCTRLINSLRATDASREKIEDAKGYNRKIQGSRASKIKPNQDPNAPIPKTISTSQQSYDQLIQHLGGLVEALATEPSYAPNEDDLKIVNLRTFKTSLATINTAVFTTFAAVSKARIERDKILYADLDSAYHRFTAAKAYVKSVFGATSPEYKALSNLSFKKPKD